MAVVVCLLALLIGYVVVQRPPASPCSELTDSAIGIAGNAQVAGYDEPALDGYMAQVVAAGASWVRLDVDWSVAEPAPGQFDWSAADRVVNAATAHGLHPLLLLAYSPAWARPRGSASTDSHAYPADPAAFGAFARAAAERYGDRANAWEVWNEPNLVQFFAPKPDVAIYAGLLRAAYTAIHAIQPDAVVISGGLAPAVDNGTNIAPPTFIDRLYQQGANRYLDAVGMHPYTYPVLPADPRSAGYNAFQRMQLLRATMVAGGDAGKKIWITEFGAPTGTFATGVSAGTQAKSIAEGIDLARQYGFVGRFFVYTLLDSDTGSSDPEQNFGLLESSHTPKSAYRSLQQAAGHSCK